MFRKIIISLFLFFLLRTPVFADSKFVNSYQVTYQIMSSGLANVTEQIEITNKSSDYYPTEQTFTYHSYNLGNIKAYDAKGEFNPQVEKNGTTTTIRVVFREKNAGIGKKTDITLKYQTSDIATLNGEVWQILIPGIKNLDFYDNFSLSLQIPDTFPEIQYVSEEPKTRWIWTKDEIQNKGLFLIFGTKQFYNLNLHYSLKNSGLTPVLDSIAIPPNTNYQEIAIKNISPAPEYSEEDNDGNWIFWFKLAAGETKDINTNVLASLSFNPDKSRVLSDQEQKEYTKTQILWDYQNFGIFSSKISNLKTPLEIYNFVVTNLNYNFNRLNKAPERFTASQSLKNPSNSICTDFTNVFIALARKNNIPAREVDGYGQTQNLELQPLSLEKDVLHAWPEYYDASRQTWVMVDPTWENTTGGIDYFNKLDLNHIAFVIKGASSETPYPAGSYKTDDVTRRDVNVTFSSRDLWQAEISKEKKVVVAYNTPDFLISGLDYSIKINIQNKSQVVLRNTPVTIKIGDNTVEKNIEKLIPYQIYEVNLSTPKVKFWDKKNIVVSTIISHKSFSKTLEFSPIYLYGNNIWYFAGGAVIIVISLIIIILLAFKSLLNKSKNKSVQNGL